MTVAPLAAIRIQQGWFPFQHIKLDYFGPSLVNQGGKMEELYECLFTCLQPRELHSEVPHPSNTVSLFMTLLRFMSRR